MLNNSPPPPSLPLSRGTYICISGPRRPRWTSSACPSSSAESPPLEEEATATRWQLRRVHPPCLPLLCVAFQNSQLRRTCLTRAFLSAQAVCRALRCMLCPRHTAASYVHLVRGERQNRSVARAHIFEPCTHDELRASCKKHPALRPRRRSRRRRRAGRKRTAASRRRSPLCPPRPPRASASRPRRPPAPPSCRCSGSAPASPTAPTSRRARAEGE